MKVVLITNIPTPYRIPVFNLLAKELQIDFHVFYMANNESNRSWELPKIEHNHTILNVDKTIKKTDGFNYVHLSKGVWKKLNELNPDIVITGGFNPPQIRAWFWSKLNGKKHIGMSDGWIKSEDGLSFFHKAIRHLIYKSSQAFIGPSINTLELFKKYGANESSCFISHLCIKNEDFFKEAKPFSERAYDLIFSGSLTERKNPLFLIEVLKLLLLKIPDLKIVFLGDGPLKNELKNELEILNVTFELMGHVSQKEIPHLMGNTKLHVFPTQLDAWGLVVNEAGAAGVPTISSPNAGVINDILIPGKTGEMIELRTELWSNKILDILLNPTHWKVLSEEILVKTKEYNFKNASIGILNACLYAHHSK
ncbi:MAG: glycosyltransferase family 4 protein [Salibacteraceae bacterium]